MSVLFQQQPCHGFGYPRLGCLDITALQRELGQQGFDTALPGVLVCMSVRTRKQARLCSSE